MPMFAEMAAANEDNSVEHVTQRGRIADEWHRGVPTRDIVVSIAVSIMTVQRWLLRWWEDGALAKRPRRGPPRG